MITRIREKGQITIPAALRKLLKISKDSVLSVAKVGDAILLTTAPSVFENVAEKFSTKAKEDNITLDDLLKDLKNIRRRK